MMKKSDVKVGGVYVAKVTGKLVQVRIDGENRHGGWDATNLATRKKVRIKSAQRLRGVPTRPATPRAVKASKGAKSNVTKGTAKPKADGKRGVQEYDPDRCATPRCKGDPAVKHLGKPLCQKCWENLCASDDGIAATIEAVETGNLAEGIVIPTPSKKARGKQVQKARNGENKPKRLSALDAAAAVLEKAGKPMRCRELIAAMEEQGLWSSPHGKTPHATLHAAITREIRKALDNGSTSRFCKAERGQFTFNAQASKE